MQRFTLKLSFQPGKRLGLILIDTPVPDTEPYGSCGRCSESDSDVVGGGGARMDGATFPFDDAESVSEDGDSQSTSSIHGVSLNHHFAAEAAAAAAKLATSDSRKRKRPTVPCVSEKSPIFAVASQLRASLQSTPELNKLNLDTIVDSMVETERPGYNTDCFKFVVTDTIKAGDIIEKIQHTRPAATAATRMPPSTGRHHSNSRRARPYYRSDHYDTFHCEDRSAVDVAGILKSPEKYPLYVTLKRPRPVASAAASAECDPPPRKRLKPSAAGRGNARNSKSTVNGPVKGEVISLLDSSDEEEATTGNSATSVPEVHMTDLKKASLLEGESQQQCVPPDPQSLPSFDEEFVQTPFGAGKILSSRVERHASADRRAGAAIFNPTVVYSIDLHYGTCHVPAGRVTPSAGSACARKTLFTYQRVPLTEHDLLRLRPLTYLNDSLIMFYLKYVKAQLEQNSERTASVGRGWDDLDGEGVHIFPSFCYTRIKHLMGPGSRNSRALRIKIWDDLKTWTRSVDIFKKKLLVFPINEALHWTCVCVCHPGRLVRKYARELVRNTVKGPSASVSTANPKSSCGEAECQSHTDNAAQDLTRNTATGAGAFCSTVDSTRTFSGKKAAKISDEQTKSQPAKELAETTVAKGADASSVTANSANAFPTEKATKSLGGEKSRHSQSHCTEKNLVENTVNGPGAHHSAAELTSGFPWGKVGKASGSASQSQGLSHQTEQDAVGKTAAGISTSTAGPAFSLPWQKEATTSGSKRKLHPQNNHAENSATGTIDSCARASVSTADPALSIPEKKSVKALGEDMKSQSQSDHGKNSIAASSASMTRHSQIDHTTSSVAGTINNGAGASISTADPALTLPREKAVKASGDDTKSQSQCGQDKNSVAASSASMTRHPQSDHTANAVAGTINTGAGTSISTADPAFTLPGEKAVKALGEDTKSQFQSDHNKNSTSVSSATITAPAKINGTRWQCDFCKEATFDNYDEALAHEKVCDKNIDWCMIHFDSGKHFKLHQTVEMTGNIRKYLNAYYDFEYAATHPGLSSFSAKNMPGFAVGVPQQDNTKDCGVYMLENAEKMMRECPKIDNEFVKAKGKIKREVAPVKGRPPATKNSDSYLFQYKKQVIEKKRDDMLQLIRTLQRGENKIE